MNTPWRERSCGTGTRLRATHLGLCVLMVIEISGKRRGATLKRTQTNPLVSEALSISRNALTTGLLRIAQQLQRAENSH